MHQKESPNKVSKDPINERSSSDRVNLRAKLRSQVLTHIKLGDKLTWCIDHHRESQLRKMKESTKGAQVKKFPNKLA